MRTLKVAVKLFVTLCTTASIVIATASASTVAWRSPKSRVSDVKVASTSLANISCASATSCIAVGSFIPYDKDAASGDHDGDGLAGRPLSERLVGNTWHELTPLTLGKGGALFDSVDCPTASHCVAVGYYAPTLHSSTSKSAATYKTLVEVFNGSSWKLAPSPNIGLSTVLNSVSCPSITSCTAVGYATAPSGQRALVEVLSRGAWSIVTGSDAARPGASFSTVSCRSTSKCVAVGGVQAVVAKALVNVPLTATSEGRHWSSSVTTTKGHPRGIYYGLTCVSVTSCTAVGEAADALGSPSALVASFNGATWKVAAGDVAKSVASTLYGVTCPLFSQCVAVGWTNGVSMRSLVAQVTGVDWQSSTTPDGTSVLSAVSCPSLSRCIVVGYRDTAAYVAVRQNGAWRSLTPPGP